VTERATTGRVTQVRRPAGRATAYTYDAASNLSEVLHNDHERTRYRYRSDGALLEATTATTTVLFERDALGRVLCETQDGHQVLSTLDALGQRLGLTSSLGASVALERDALGQVRRTQAGTW
jgi:YD repeat-containing protein